MKSINSAFTGLASSLLLNVGLTRFAEKLDPMQRDGRSIRNMFDNRSAAFSESVCNFRSSAFSESVCNFRSAAFSESVCNFRSAAFCESVCNFRSAAFSESVCNFTPQGS